jgi:hypothetical protein
VLPARLAHPSRWCNGTHKTLLKPWSWFDSRSGYCCRAKPCLSLECAGFAREPAKLVDQVRFLARTLVLLARSASKCIGVTATTTLMHSLARRASKDSRHPAPRDEILTRSVKSTLKRDDHSDVLACAAC